MDHSQSMQKTAMYQPMSQTELAKMPPLRLNLSLFADLSLRKRC